MRTGALLLLGFLMTGATQALAGDLASPMVDWSLYRDGAVHRTTRRFGAWTVVCDTIGGLRQRFCSLRSATWTRRDADAIGVDVSTGDDGRPAALLHLPLVVSLAYGVRPSVDARSAPTPRAPRPQGGRTGRPLDVARCGPAECLAVWPLTGSEIDVLRRGGNIGLTICRPLGGGRLEFTRDLRARSCGSRTTTALSGDGFRDAVQATLE